MCWRRLINKAAVNSNILYKNTNMSNNVHVICATGLSRALGSATRRALKMKQRDQNYMQRLATHIMCSLRSNMRLRDFFFIFFTGIKSHFCFFKAFWNVGINYTNVLVIFYQLNERVTSYHCILMNPCSVKIQIIQSLKYNYNLQGYNRAEALKSTETLVEIVRESGWKGVKRVADLWLAPNEETNVYTTLTFTPWDNAIAEVTVSLQRHHYKSETLWITVESGGKKMQNNARFSWGHPPVAVKNMLLFDNMLPVGLHLPAIALDFTKFLIIIKKVETFFVACWRCFVVSRYTVRFSECFHIRISIYLGRHVAHSTVKLLGHSRSVAHRCCQW